MLQARNLCLAFFLHGRFQVESRRAHEDHVDRTQDQEIIDKTNASRQKLHDRPGYQRGKAKAHDGKTCRKAAMIGEILYQRRYRRDVADAKANTANNPVEKV